MRCDRYAVVDIETTGGKASRDKITEIAIILYDGEKIIDRWESLINPECYIPYGITQLTGITQEMVRNAPKFYEVAKIIIEKTEGAIFVAHNVRFDYEFLREEFKRLGFTFTRKQLCTVRLSRQAFVGFRSYGLDSLIREFNIQVQQRHRAMGDALATVEVLGRILAKETGQSQAKDLINLGIKESLLPANITIEQLHELPEACGVYYFHDKEGRLAYIGKSINIRKRVAEHFADISEKARKLQSCVHDISYEITGSELIALLYESHEIKVHRPYINRAQRVRNFPYAIHSFENEQGYLSFEVIKTSTREQKKIHIVSEYPKAANAKAHLQRAVAKFELCPKLCQLESNINSKVCFHYHLKQCHGACGHLENAATYNERATAAQDYLSNMFDRNFIILDQGRTPNEKSVVVVENGEYCGFTYLDESDGFSHPEQIRVAIRPHFESNPEVKRIILRFIQDEKKLKVVYF
jgi:DNA polymerase-3 subunit epsilon